MFWRIRTLIICSEFARTVKERVFKHFSDQKRDPKHAPWMIVWYITINLSLLLTQWLVVCPRAIC